MTPPSKRQVFQWTPKILKFFILLKVNKLLLKMSQFEFLVMIEKKIFTYKVFLSLNILDFNLFFMWQLQTPWKKSPHLFSQEPPSESWGPVKAPLFENLVGGSTPPPSPFRKVGGVHTMRTIYSSRFYFTFNQFGRVQINALKISVVVYKKVGVFC